MIQGQEPDEEQVRRVAHYLAQALTEMRRGSGNDGSAAVAQEIAAARAELAQVAARLELQLADEKEQRLALAGQLTGLAGSLDALVSHLHGLSQIMLSILERVETPSTPQAPAELAFAPGGEGLSLVLIGVPGFQALMDLQKALMTLAQVSGVSVERFQEGDSRLLVHLSAPITASALVHAVQAATGYSLAVEESRPEFSRLRLKLVPAT